MATFIPELYAGKGISVGTLLVVAWAALIGQHKNCKLITHLIFRLEISSDVLSTVLCRVADV